MSTLNLRQFMLRRETLNLYKKFLRLTRHMSERKSKDEMVKWIKEDFRLNKNLKDEIMYSNLTTKRAIRMQHSRGKAAYEELHNSIDLSRAINDINSKKS